MGLPAEVRNFFTNRINAVIAAKEAIINKAIDRQKVAALAFSRLCSDWRISPADIERLDEIEQQRDALEKEGDKLRAKLRGIAETNSTSLSYYKRDIVGTLRGLAHQKFEEDILAELYPAECAELAKLQAVREDIYGVVLLATTEPRLVKTLTAVLNKYGGEIDGLLALVPEQE